MSVAAASTANRSRTPFVPPKNSITKKLKPYPQFLIFETGPVLLKIRRKKWFLKFLKVNYRYNYWYWLSFIVLRRLCLVGRLSASVGLDPCSNPSKVNNFLKSNKKFSLAFKFEKFTTSHATIARGQKLLPDSLEDKVRIPHELILSGRELFSPLGQNIPEIKQHMLQ